MNTLRLITSSVLALILPAGLASAQLNGKLGENAALRYWSAFAQMQDSALTDQQAKGVNTMLDGTAPYDDLKYTGLVEKNRLALETMARATVLRNCDWGLDYKLGEDVPVDYARKALALGRLNVLYAFHLLIVGDKDRAVNAITAGLHFSQDVANGGSLFATVAAKNLLVIHVRAVAFALHVGELPAGQRIVLQRAVAQLRPNVLNWQSATKRDLESLRGRFSRDPEASAALTRIISSYIGALNSPANLPALQEVIAGAPGRVADQIPNPKRVMEEKQDLADKLSQTRAMLQ
jgi:hypothetical protein